MSISNDEGISKLLDLADDKFNENLDSQLKYWKQQLVGSPPLLELPTDRPRPTVQSFRGAHQSFTLSLELTKALSLLIRREGVTLFMALLAAFDTLLYRYTGTEDILVGSPIANRNHGEIEELIGFFVNTLVLRTDMSGNPSFQELLGRVREVALQADTHQDLPFQILVEELQPQRDLSYSPLFQVMFAFEEDVSRQKLELFGLTANSRVIENNTAKFDLTLFLEQTSAGLVGKWAYNTDLFDASTIERMTRHFQTILEGIVANPKQLISELPLLTADERQQLLCEWNHTQTDYSQDKCIHQLFEEQVERTPDAVALVFEEQQLTYRELNRRANQLAHYLKTLGVGPEVLVGICVERSLEMVVGMLGIIKAGGAYVPLEPRLPQERLSFMLLDSQVTVLLTQQQLVEGLHQPGTVVVCLDTDWEKIAQENDLNLESLATPENLIYVIFTSGSTGKAKGVEIEHQQLLNYLHGIQERLSLSGGGNFAIASTFAADLGNTVIFPSLCSGGCLHILSIERASDPNAFLDYCQQYPIDCLKIVPSHLSALLSSSPHPETILPRQRLILGGEATSWDLIEKIQHYAPTCQIFNHYGPTEATVGVLTYAVNSRPIDYHTQIVPLGRPLPNTQIYLLDRQRQPVPIGVPGELYIGGAGLARGYLNRPDLTQEKFIPNPFENSKSRSQSVSNRSVVRCATQSQNSKLSRLYKTGDLARYLPDGNIEYLGRIDHQVKIRGNRVELGEIEASLSQHPALAQTVVIAHENVLGDKRLVAYIVPNQELTPTINDLRHFLSQKLPDYMIPSAFAILDTLPLTPNGKVDRRALPIPDTNSLTVGDRFVAPTTPTQEVLAAIWSQVLGLDKVGIHDNFFELGGHSLLATQIISSCYQTFCVKLSLRQLFATPTVAGLAVAITNAQMSGSGLSDYQIIPQTNQQSALLSFAQQRLWFLEQLEPNRSDYHICQAVRLSGALNVTALQLALDAIVAHHEVLRTNFIYEDGNPIQVIGTPRPVELASVDLQEYPPTQQQTEIQRRLQHSRQRPFNLSEDLMLRGSLLQIGPQEHILLLVMHHIASDGWSRGILLQQLNSLYKAFCHGQPNPLPKMPIQYADFAVWQRQWLQGVGADPCSPQKTQLDYWKQQLAGANPVLELPTDYPRPPVQTYSGASQSIVLNQSLTTALKVLSRREQVTLFMTLLAAFQTLLYRYSGQEDIIVGSPIAGRNRTELEGLIGFFINTLVLRTHLGGNLSFRELLDRVCQMTLSAHSNQDMPFEKLVEELQLKRDLSRNPLFQVWFNMLNLEEIQLELPGLTVEPILMPEVASKFDLSLYVKEQNQEIKLELVYNPDLFARERMVEMLDQFHHLLLQIVANPETSIAELSLVTPTAKLLLPNPIQQLRSQWVGAVHTSFSQQAQKEPQQLAVVDANVASWTYAELEERTNLLANYLVANHIQPQDIVAIYGHRSATLVWAILGVLKAGAAFVILDPAYPTSRLIDYLHLAQPRASLQITAAGELPVALSEYLETLSCRCHLKLTQDSMVAIRRLFQDYATHDPGIAVGPDHLAYVAFTSGSTGKPKGILGVHKPLSHFLQWHCQTFGLDQSDRFSMLSGLSHDPLFRDIFTPLSLGATLCIPTQNDIATPGKLADWMEQQRVSVAHLTPAMTQLLTATTVTTKYLRYLFFGGDILKVEDLRRIRDFAPTAQSVNFYGATETPQAMGYFTISNQGSSILPNGNVPLGRGIEDVQLLLLNAKQQLAGIGEVGEIYVRTPYLTKGYIGSDELTQKRFIINPLTKIPDDRLYKTGDLGRYLPDSNIEFLGRIDHQVKIRGFRIELGEIEAMLSKHPAVQKTVVIVREDVPGDKRLVAYLVPRQEQAPTSELRHFLKQQLPDYMVPSAFVMLAAFPLTPNGKIDRSALPAPEHQRQESEETFVAPRDELELQLTEIWEKVLGVQPIGIRDNFFTLGGHSLIAVRVFTEIEQIWGRNLPLITLFQTQTVEALADILRQERCIAPWSSLVLIQPGQSKPPLFCIHPIGGNVLEYYGLAHYLGREQPVYGLQAQGLDGKQVPISRVEDMANHYIKEIRTVQPNGPYFLAGYSFGGVVAFEMAQQLYAQGQKVALLALLDVKSPNLLHIRPSFAESVRIHLSNLWQLEPEERLKYIRDRIEYRVGKVNYKDFLIRELSKTGILTNQYLKVLDSNLQASKDYITPVYPGVVTLFRCQVQLLEFALHPELGWGELVTRDLEIHHIPGDHFGLLKEPRVRVLAEKLKLCLERLQTDP